MTTEQALEISRQRLEGWAQRLAEQRATPVMLLGVTHGDEAGTLICLIPKEVTHAQARDLLKGGLWLLGGK